ncbi:hypothetical protein NIES267_12650 [Calothrix parasitica NIES-267]|uniref:Uncharacterized protein n=1 Tax=Calothrix parasitica NIES-267 TaxID=1973488 RepID=A0A1Z4LL28_9CYAN|nr:hypothetical protein NIES267_12650 [Calothrix parasitica NIES-267]
MSSKYSAEGIKVNPIDDEVYESLDFSKDNFEKSLIQAANQAREFTQKYVTNNLPERIQFKVYLNCSYDEHAMREGELRITRDWENEIYEFDTPAEVINLIWIEGKIPEWINVKVESENGKSTTVALICCGRFSSNPRHIYHILQGLPPFQVVGPPLPSNWEGLGKSGKFQL